MPSRGWRGPGTSPLPQVVSAFSDAVPRAVADDGAMSTNGRIVELADRHSIDHEVVLLWARRSGRLWVDVSDRGASHIVSIDATAANAMDVFHHPFLYAREAA